ncbi:MAG TPA: hypothetical protein VME45_19780 [Stellaceae bacterium]|nr:hypothetical protein [Stellaceae bacterium]
MSDVALADFGHAPVDDPEFREDAVREEVTWPLLVRLGYASSGDSRIIRSRRLAHRARTPVAVEIADRSK